MSANDIGQSEKSSSALSAEAAVFVPTSVSNNKTTTSTQDGGNQQHDQGHINHQTQQQQQHASTVNVSPSVTTAVAAPGWKGNNANNNGGVGIGFSSSSSTASVPPTVPPPLPYMNMNMMNCFQYLPINGSMRPQLTRFPPPYNIPPELSMSNGIVPPLLPPTAHQEAGMPLVSGHHQQLNPAAATALALHALGGSGSASDNNSIRPAHHQSTIIPPPPPQAHHTNPSTWGVVSMGQHHTQQQQPQFISTPQHHPHHHQPPPQQQQHSLPAPLRPPSHLHPRFQHRFNNQNQQQYNNNKTRPQNNSRQQHPHPFNHNFQQNRLPNQFQSNLMPSSHIPPQDRQPHPFHPSQSNHHHHNHNQLYHQQHPNHPQPKSFYNQSDSDANAVNDNKTSSNPLSTSSASATSTTATKSSSLVIQNSHVATATTTAVVTSTPSVSLSSSTVSNTNDRTMSMDARPGRKKYPESERPSSPVLISRSSQTDKIPLGVKELTLRQKPHPLFIKNQSSFSRTTTNVPGKKGDNKKGNNCDNSNNFDSSSQCNMPTCMVEEEVVFDQYGCILIQTSPVNIDKFSSILSEINADNKITTTTTTTATIITARPLTTTATTSISATTNANTTITAFTNEKTSSRASVSYSRISSIPPPSRASSSHSASVLELRGTKPGESDIVQNMRSPAATTDADKKRRKSNNRKKRGESDNSTDDYNAGNKRRTSRGVTAELPQQKFGLLGGWEKNDEKINLQSWTDFPPMGNNSSAKSSSLGGVTGNVAGMGLGQSQIITSGASQDPHSSSVVTGNGGGNKANGKDIDLSASGPVTIQRVQGAPPWSLKEQQQQQHQKQQQGRAGNSGLTQAKATSPASYSSTSSSLPVKSYATTTAVRSAGGAATGLSRDSISVKQSVPVHEDSKNPTAKKAIPSSSNPTSSSSPINKNPNIAVPSNMINPSNPSFPVKSSSVANKSDYPPLSSTPSSTLSNNRTQTGNKHHHHQALNQPSFNKQLPYQSSQSVSDKKSYPATNKNSTVFSQSQLNTHQFPPLGSYSSDNTNSPITNNTSKFNIPQASLQSRPESHPTSAKDPVTRTAAQLSNSNLNNKPKSSSGAITRGKSKSPGRDSVQNSKIPSGSSSAQRNKSKSPARFLHTDGKIVDSQSYADKIKTKNEIAGDSLMKDTRQPKNIEGVSDGNKEAEEGEGDEDDDEKSTTKRRRQRRRRRNHVRTKKGGGEFIMNDHDETSGRSLNGEDGADMMLHFEDTEEFPDLLSSISRGHSQDTGNALGDRSSLSGTSQSYSDMARGSWSRREQSLSRTHSLTGSCVSEDNLEDSTVETKRARKRRKRREQANKAAETELAEISLEQELLREGLKKTGGLRAADRWKNQNSPGLISSPAIVREVKKAGGATQGSGKKSKQPIALDLAAMIEASKSKLVDNKQSPKSSIKGDSRSSSAKRSTHSTSQTRGSNPLDSSGPLQKRGKEREFPKAKKPSPLKKVILKEREAKKQMRLMDGKDMDEFGNPHGVGMVGVDSELSQDALSSKSEATDLERVGGDSQPTNLSADLSPISQTSPISMSPASPGNSGLNSPVTGSVGRDSVIQKIHSRRFREYCNQVLDKEIDQCCTDLLQDLVRFQDRLYHKDPMRAKRKRRVVLGLREVTKHLRLKKIKCVVISPNLEKIQSKGGLDEALNNILSMCQEQDVPFVFALGRRALGRACAKLVPVSVVGVFSYQNCEENYNRLVSLTDHARSAYNEMVAAVEKEVAAASSFNSVPGLIPAHMGHSRTPSGCSAISFTSSVISEPHSEYYSSYADELRISDGNNSKNNQGQGYNNNDLDDGNEADIEDFGGDSGRRRRGGVGGNFRGNNSVRFDDKRGGNGDVDNSTCDNNNGVGGVSSQDGKAILGSDSSNSNLGGNINNNNNNNDNNNKISNGSSSSVDNGGSGGGGVSGKSNPLHLNHNHGHHNHIHGHHRRQSSVSSLARIMEGIDDDKEDVTMATTTTTIVTMTAATSLSHGATSVSATASTTLSSSCNVMNSVSSRANIGSGVKESSSVGAVDVKDPMTKGVGGGGSVEGQEGLDKVGSGALPSSGVTGEEEEERKREKDVEYGDERNEEEDDDDDVDVEDVDEDDEEEDEDDDEEREAAVANSRNRLRGHTRQKSMDKKERIENWLSAQSNLSNME